MPFPEKEYYKIIMELENEEYNNSNSNYGNSINNNPADIATTGLYGNYYANNIGIGLFRNIQYNNVTANNEGIGLFHFNNNNAGKSLFDYNSNKTGISLFGNNTEISFGKQPKSIFGNYD